MHVRIFSKNIWARDYVHACIISRNIRTRAYSIFCARGVRACTYTIFHARASVSILAHTSECLCVCAQDYSIIRAHALSSIHAPGGRSLFLSIVLFNSSMALY